MTGLSVTKAPSSEEVVSVGPGDPEDEGRQQCLSRAAFQEAASKQDRVTGISHLLSLPLE